ncbi:hypothetical protein JR316_0004227 [Psilocybe cubensis]|uniref:Uncharacterized protein n=2 Tax=Psilocybe cubensis TaxID=181762 RepID=A0ACB8H391_PSICU|nr:hypothetical protein JR316_0004227 [Psilocybe cubensis]KAH9482132.1 hypothetical protein JR316_0004227 [Psilocybe cubensis]
MLAACFRILGCSSGTIEIDSNSAMLPQDGLGDVRIPPLSPVPSGLAKPDDRLCDTCSQLGLTVESFTYIPGNEDAYKEQIYLGLVKDIKEKMRCPLCRLILASIGSELPCTEDGQPLSISFRWETDPRSSSCAMAPYAWKPGGRYANPKRLNAFPRITVLANDTTNPCLINYVRPIEDTINFNMVSNWLYMCEDWHGDVCEKSKYLDGVVDNPTALIPTFRLIDVVENCILFAPANVTYVALSYVWGKIDPTKILRLTKGTINDLAVPGALLQQQNYDITPITIRDAIQVTREIGIRYLWVDSLCIVQDDVGPGGSKMDAISKMDLIYGAAYLTIIAATGGDANAGLPGVRPGTRKIPQLIEEIYPGLRLANRPSDLAHIPNIHRTRAWTYQELRFAKRSLSFIGGQAVFQCCSYNWREDVVFEDRSWYLTSNRSRTVELPNKIFELESMIYGYSGLSLTNEEDIYDAFAGLARFFRTKLGSNLCHGIPDTDFDWFLLWTAQDPPKRRPHAPSWSWSGWQGEMRPMSWWRNRPSTEEIREIQKERTWIVWYERKAHHLEECQRVSNPENSSQSSSRLPPNPETRLQSRFPFDCSQTLPTPRKLVNAPKYIQSGHSEAGSGFLQFWTVSVTFRLAEPESRENPSFGPRNTHSRIGIFGRNGQEISIVYVNPDWRHRNLQPQRTHEFILLSEGVDHDLRLDASEKDLKYMVMLIDWQEDGQWAERVAVTSMEKTALDQAFGQGPIWKEIILG